MGKKRKSTEVVATPEKPTAPAASEAKPVQQTSQGKKKKNEIDDIFAAASGKLQEAADVEEDIPEELAAFAAKLAKARAKKKAQNKDDKAQVAGSKTKVDGSKDDIFGQETKTNRKKTEEGYAIYTEDELNMGKQGGNTDLCPFDCDCCF